MTPLWLLPSLLLTCHLFCVAMAVKRLYIGGLFDLNANDVQSVISAAQVAIQEINRDPFIPGYHLELLVNNTRESDFTSASGVNSYLDNGPKKIMLLGPADNDIAKAVAHHAGVPAYGVLQFSYGTNDLDLANSRGRYPYFFRTRISMATFNDLRIAFLKYYRFTEVGIVYGDSIHEAKLSNELKTRIESESKIKVLAEIRLQVNDPERAIRTIQDKNIHVIIGLFSLDIAARRLFCQAHRHGLYGPHYVWILQMANKDGWWNPGPGEDIGGCQSIEMMCQIRNYFSVKPTTEEYINAAKFSHSKKNTSQVLDALRIQGNVTSVDDAMMYAYDAIWSIAHVLNKSRGTLGKPLENVTYGELYATNIFYSETLKLNFGSPKLKEVSFFQNGDRKFQTSVEQFIVKDENSLPVREEAGIYSFRSGLYNENKVTWLANTPYKKITETRDARYIHRALFGALIFLACLGILYALVCFATVLLFRKQSIIWNSSPIISIIVILGCILNYITIILYAFDWTTTANTTSFCRARAWTFAIGFTLSVGGLVAKLWIAYCVLIERFVKRWRNMMIWMLSIILVLFILDFIIIGCWERLDPLYAKIETYKEQEEYKCFQPITDKTFLAYYYTTEHCSCNNPFLWLLIILILKFLVVIFGVFLAWQTRKLYIKSLNDTQYCAFCLFVVLFFVVFGVLFGLLSTSYPNIFFAIVGIFLFLCTTIILGLLFIHKLARVVCKPRRARGKRILVGGAATDTESASSSRKSCSWCGWSSACCIACCGCFPCCNMYFCCRSCCLGSKIHPNENSHDDKTEFYIAGQPQDKEGQIAYLLREIHELPLSHRQKCCGSTRLRSVDPQLFWRFDDATVRDNELSRLRPKHTSVSMWTQTYDDDMGYLVCGDGEESSMESDSSDGSTNNRGRKRKAKGGTKFKIFNHGADYSHIQSKVDSRIAKQPQKSPKTQRKHDEKYYLGVWKSNGGRTTNAEIAKLRLQLEEKNKEIEQMRKEKEGGTSVVVHQANGPSSKVMIVNENLPVTREMQCQTEESLLYSNQLQRDNPNDVIVVKERLVKKEQSSHDKSNDVIVGKETKAKNEQSSPPLNKSSNVIVFMDTESSPSKNLYKERKVSRTEPKDNIRVVDVKAKNGRKKSRKENEETIKSPGEWLFGKPDNDRTEENTKKDANVNVMTQASGEQEKKDDLKPSKKEEDKKNIVIINRSEEPQKIDMTRQNNNTNVVIARPGDAPEKNEHKNNEKISENPNMEEERRIKEENRREEDKIMKDEKRLEEERKKEEKREKKNKEDEKRREEEKRIEDEKRKDEERRKESVEEEKRKEIEGKKEENRQETEREKEKKRKENEKKIEDEKGLEEERKRDEEKREAKNKEEESSRNRQEGKQKEKERIEQERNKVAEIQKEVNKLNAQFDDEDVITIRPPQNTPASVDGQQDEGKNKKDEPSNKGGTLEKEEPKKPENENNDYNNDDMTKDGDKDGDKDNVDDDGDDDDNDDDGDCSDVEDDDDNKNKDENGPGDDDKNKEDTKESSKRKGKQRQPIGGKLNWNAQSKIDTTSGYKKKSRKKIKTYKVDYSHVKSKFSYGTTNKQQDERDKEEKEKEKKKRKSMKRKRWNPDNGNNKK